MHDISTKNTINGDLNDQQPREHYTAISAAIDEPPLQANIHSLETVKTKL